MNVTPCTPCCATPQTVNIPGVEGDPGTNGTNGLNAYTVLTAPVVVPAAVNNTVAIAVASTLWMVVGQIVIVGQGATGVALGGPATFSVDSITSASGFVGKWLQYSGDVAALSTISAGASVSPNGGAFVTPVPIASGGTGATTIALALKALGLMSTGNIVPISVYGSGAVGSTAYVMTAAAINDPSTEVNINGTAIEINITTAGTWLLAARLKLDYNGATFAAVKTVNSKLRRSNNTAADVTNAANNFVVPVITTLTYTGGIIQIPPVVYTTANTNDNIQLLSRIATLPGAGTVEIAEASILATKLY